MEGIVMYLLPREQQGAEYYFPFALRGIFDISKDTNTNPCYMSDLETDIPLRYLCTVLQC